MDSLLSTVYYRSRELSALWNKILFIEKVNNQWQLSATNIVNQTETELIPTSVLNLDPKQINSANQLSLYIPRENELLLWDRSQAIIYKVLPQLLTNKESALEDELEEESGSNTLLYIVFMLVLVVITFVFLKKQYGQNVIRNKSFLRTNYVRFYIKFKAGEVSP